MSPILTFLGGFTAEIAGDRAVAQIKMTISQRAEVHGVPVDVVCTDRFFDFVERLGWRRHMPQRPPISEKHRMDPLIPGATLNLDAGKLTAVPVGYRHLTYLQSEVGYPVKAEMQGLKVPEVETLYATGRDRLAGRTRNPQVQPCRRSCRAGWSLCRIRGSHPALGETGSHLSGNTRRCNDHSRDPDRRRARHPRRG